MDEADQQAEIARKYESAIAALEPFVVRSEDGQFSFGQADISAVDADAQAVQELVASVQDLNASISDQAVALNDVQTSTPGIAHG
jgi:hypothetical protein